MNSALVEKSYAIAREALEGKERENHRPFMEHPENVAKIVSDEIGLRDDAVCAVYLHEASRGNEALQERLRKEFPADIMNMVEGLNNISRITPKETRLQAENYRKMIVSYSKDPRVTLIKIADRLEIMRNLGFFPKSSQMRKLTETQMLYIPLAHQLGLYKIKGEMENLYFRYSDPEHFRAISNKLLATRDAGIPAIVITSGVHKYTNKTTDDIGIINFNALTERCKYIFKAVCNIAGMSE